MEGGGMIAALCAGIALGTAVGWAIRDLAGRGRADDRTEGRLHLLEQASLRHGAYIKVHEARIETLEGRMDDRPVRYDAERIYTEAEDAPVIKKVGE